MKPEFLNLIEPGSILLSKEASSILKISNVEKICEVSPSVLPSIPKHKTRQLISALNEVKDLLTELRKTTEGSYTILLVHDAQTKQFSPMNKENSYALCYWNQEWSRLPDTDQKKSTMQNWLSLTSCLSTHEKDVAWRIKHGAICTPQLAMHMGLKTSNKCF